jgi:hypothetical protein
MTKTAAEFAVAFVAAIRLVWRRNRQLSLPQEGSGYVPADFQAEKTKIIAPGPVSVEGRRNRFRQRGEGIKTICQSSYSPNTATADIFRFQRGEIEAGRPFAVPGLP